MDIFQVFRDRRSIRKYKDTPVEREKIEQVLDAARLAPSWKNLQCWRFLVLTDPARIEVLLSSFAEDNPGRKAFLQAPVAIVVCADPAESDVSHGIEYFVADTAIAFEHICLAAHALGLGTCWMGMFDEKDMKSKLSIPDNLRVVGVTPLGYPDQEPKPRPRKVLHEIAFYNDWPK
ncbi:MAG: nitroreductase family protein [Desulfuromonadaceae bacterium]|nr:nitroreductase family protein [Desulfuromonadaceae bacterium]